MESKKAFTLIELLVVISIISLLSSVVLASLNQARIKARDSQRISQLLEINKAIQLYISDNGYAPGTGGGCDPQLGSESDCVAQDYNSSWEDLESTLINYIAELPADPCGESCPDADSDRYYIYKYQSPASIRYYVDEGSIVCDGDCSSSYILNALLESGELYKISTGFGSI